MTGPKPVALPLGYVPTTRSLLKISKIFYKPSIGTCKISANLLARFSISLKLKGVPTSVKGISPLSLMQKRIKLLFKNSSLKLYKKLKFHTAYQNFLKEKPKSILLEKPKNNIFKRKIKPHHNSNSKKNFKFFYKT